MWGSGASGKLGIRKEDHGILEPQSWICIAPLEILFPQGVKIRQVDAVVLFDVSAPQNTITRASPLTLPFTLSIGIQGVVWELPHCRCLHLRATVGVGIQRRGQAGAWGWTRVWYRQFLVLRLLSGDTRTDAGEGPRARESISGEEQPTRSHEVSCCLSYPSASPPHPTHRSRVGATTQPC